MGAVHGRGWRTTLASITRWAHSRGWDPWELSPGQVASYIRDKEANAVANARRIMALHELRAEEARRVAAVLPDRYARQSKLLRTARIMTDQIHAVRAVLSDGGVDAIPVLGGWRSSTTRGGNTESRTRNVRYGYLGIGMVHIGGAVNRKLPIGSRIYCLHTYPKSPQQPSAVKLSINV